MADVRKFSEGSFVMSPMISVTLYRDMVADKEDILRQYVDELLAALPDANVIEIRAVRYTRYE